ncbi:hypothetical protein Tco_0630060 [Tanacetum coccineum]
MAEETSPTIPLSISDERPSGSDPKEPLVGANISHPTIEDHTPDRSLENMSEDPIMQFVAQNFEQINAMYSAFSSKRKEVNPTSAYNNDDHPVIELWRNCGRAQATRTGLVSFLSYYPEWGCPVLKTQAEILGIRQKSEESLKDYLARFGKETLHMVDRSGGMMTGAFISGLRPGRAFKELIAQPLKSLEDLYVYINGFIRAEEANDANRCRDSKSIWKAFGGNTRDLGSFGEETDKTTNLHQHLSRISTQKLETASQITRDAVTTHLKTASQDL